MSRTKIYSKAGAVVKAAMIGIAATLCFAQGAMAQTALPYEYTITGNGTLFTATRFDGGSVASNLPIQAVIDAIKAETWKPCAIIFGAGGAATLDIGAEGIVFDGGAGGGDWGGPITLRGKISSATAAVITLNNNASINSGADITNTATYGPATALTKADGIYNKSTGSVTISAGTVSAMNSNAIYNESTGAVIIGGGTISPVTGIAIYNASTGPVTVSNGTVITNNVSIYNASTGSITISGGTFTAGCAVRNVSTGPIAISGGTISGTTQSTIEGGNAAVTISGGTISATTGTAVSGGQITISGGRVSATTGMAIRKTNSGKITISGSALVTSANTTANSGTISLGSGNPAVEGLVIEGGTIENTANSADARTIHTGSNAVTASGGKILAKSGYAIYKSNASCVVNLTGGVVFAYGTSANNVIYGTYTQDIVSMIIAWNQAKGNTSYTKSSSTDLFALAAPPPTPAFPAAAAYLAIVEWDTPNRIAYNYDNVNKGFIEIEGVTVSGGSTSVQTPRRANSANPAQFVQASGSMLQLRFADRGSVAVYALNGAKVRAFDLGSGSHTLRMNDLPRGTYMVSATGGAWRQSAKMVVR